MSNNLFNSFQSQRRQFLKYMVSGAVGITTIGLLFPKQIRSTEKIDLENLCSLYPQNSRCANYLPGVEALDSEKKPIAVDTLLSNSNPGDRILAKGLPRDAYLLIETGPKIAEYAINPVCTHLGCTVNWNVESNQFVCPCHGSRYDPQGRVVEGPAKRPLPLVTVVVKQNQVRLVKVAPAVDPRK